MAEIEPNQAIGEKLVDRYFSTLGQCVSDAEVTVQNGGAISVGDGVTEFIRMARTAHEADRKLIMIGNGASATMASHFALDFSKNGGMRSVSVNDGAMLTALVNDIGRDAIFAEQVGYYAQAGDLLMAVSSSGQSSNVLAAVEVARARDCGVITFSGFSPNNPLRASGDLNFYIPQDEYGFVEVAHTALIHAILDLSLGWGTEDDRNPGALKKRRQAIETRGRG